MISGAVLVLIGGLWVALMLSSPSPGAITSAVERDVPRDWLASPSAEVDAYATPVAPMEASGTPPGESSPEDPLAASEAVSSAGGPVVFETSGSLVFESRGRSFGDEAYRLSVTDGRTRLESTGTFRFKVVVAMIHVSFEQTLEADATNRPTRYALDFDAPLGFGQTIDASFSNDRLVVVRNDDETSTPLVSDSLYVVGTFSSYALLPVYFADHPEMRTKSYDVLSFGGPSGSQANDGALPTMRVDRAGLARLRTQEFDVEVERYRITSDMGEGMLYARDRELLAFSAGDEADGESLLVYRVDFFPSGVEIVD